MNDFETCFLDLNFSSQLLKNSFQHYYKNPTIIFDIGSCESKIGLSVNPDPITFPSIHGDSKLKIPLFNVRDFEVGERAIQRKGVLRLKYPIEANGRTSDWIGVQRIFDHSFELLEMLDVEKRFHLLLSENSATGHQDVLMDRKGKAEYLFEKEMISKIAIVNQTILTLASYGLCTGTVLHSGHTQSVAVCIEDCKLVTNLDHSLHNTLLEVGGFKMTEYFTELLHRNAIYLGHHTQTISNQIKETLCKVKLSSSGIPDEKYELPDGFDLVIKGEWLEEITERLFNYGSYVVERLVHSAISQLHDDKKSYFYKNIVLGGGNCQFPGFRERLLIELDAKIANRFKSSLNIHQFVDYKYLEYKGGCILSEFSSFQHESMISKDKYDEEGSSIFHRCQSV